MGVSAGTLALLIGAGLDGERLLDVVRSIEADTAKPGSSGAERQRRYRARKAERDVTGDVTRDASPPPEEKVSPTPPSKTQTYLPPSPPKGAHGSTDYPPNAFEIWYGGYPHKVGRGAAERAFGAVRRGGKASFAELIAGRDRYIRTKPPDRDWCNPATWLNQQRWLDEPDTPTLRVIDGKSPNNPSGNRGFGAQSGAQTQFESIARQIARFERDGGS